MPVFPPSTTDAITRAAMPDQQILRGTAGTLSWQPTDQYGEAAAPTGTITVAVWKANGDELIPAGTATSGSSTNPRTYTLTAAQTVNLDLLTVEWTDQTTAVTYTTYAEIVGGFYFSIAELRAWDASITLSAYPDATVRSARRHVEEQCEKITGRAWVPRYRRVRTNGRGDGSLLLEPSIRAVREGTIDGVALTSDELAALVPNPGVGFVWRSDFGRWTSGTSNVVLGYEVGADRPPEDLKRAAMLHCRHVLGTPKAGVDSRATQFSPIEGGTVLLATPGRFGWETGIPEVDAVYLRYAAGRVGIA